MTNTPGYWVDLFGVQFDESTPNVTWIQAMPLGTYTHPVFGKMTFDAPTVQQYADNVNNKVRGQDLDIDYDHKEYGGEAAGWVQKAEAREDGLYLLVEWTKKAADMIKAKAYRYFSPEFIEEWTHPKTNEKHKNVLFGGGITNRPFLKDILPVNMSEVFEHAGDYNPPKKEKEVTPEEQKALATKLGLKEDATIEEILAVDIPTVQTEPVTTPPVPVAASEKDELVKLAEDHPAIKTLMATVNSLVEENAANKQQLSETRAAAKVTQLNEAATKKGFALSSASKERLTKAFTEGDVESYEEAITGLLDDGLVALGERGHTHSIDGEKTASEKLSVEVRKLMEADKLSYADAVSRVASLNPALYEEYRAESYAGRE
jgi:phage I-like protein